MKIFQNVNESSANTKLVPDSMKNFIQFSESVTSFSIYSK